MTEHKIEEILQKNTIEWMKISGVVGAGLGRNNNRPCIKIYVSKITKHIKKLFPKRIENYDIIIEHTGPFEAKR